MKNLHLLDEIVREFEQDVNLPRIKKLIVCVIKGVWENEQSKLDSLNVRDLVQEVCEVTITLKNLKIALKGIIRKINKPEHYYKVANTIVIKLAKLYPDYEDPAQPISNRPDVPDTHEQFDTKQQSDNGKKRIVSYDRFDLRLKIMQQANPMRAKIVIFSTLYHKFTLCEQDWAIVKQQDLDDLLLNLFYACESPAVLASKLSSTANSLVVEPTEENVQAARVIVQHMTPLYGSGQKNSAEVQGSKEQTSEDTDSGRNKSEEITQKSGGRRGETPTANDVNGRDSDYCESIAQPVQISTNPSHVPEQEDTSDYSNYQLDQSPVQPQPKATASGDSSRKFSLSALNLSDSFKHKQELKEKLKGLVSQRVESLISVMENTLSELESSLEPQLQGLNAEEYLSLKYEALGDFIQQVKGTSPQFMEILSRLEQAERQGLLEQERASK